MSQRPLIILAFSHVNQTLSADARNLSKEQFQIQSLLSPLAQQELCEISVIAQCTVDLLFDAIKKDGHRLIGLHYSSDVETLIKIREGELKSMERAFRGKLGKYLGSLEKLKWVFLNGDGSQEQSEALIQHGVSLIVRSQNLINDDAAFRFAFFFYQALAHGHCLGKCCYVARDEVRSDYSHKAKLTYSQDLPSGYGSDWPFDFMVNPNRWQPLLWHIHSDSQKNDHLLPKIEDQPLPQLPFKDFEAFFEEDSSLFFGRQELIRQIFDALTLNAQRKPFMILSGPAGSGKTSLVCSSLGIRLKDLFEVRYQPFDQDGLSTLSSALGVDENAYLSKEWHSIETAYHQSHLKPQIITDLMNEVQAAFRKNYRTEKADFQTDFQSFFNTMKTLWLQSDQVDGDNLISKLGELFEYQKRMTQLQNQNLEEDEQLRPLLVFMDDMEKAFDLQTSDQKDRQEKFWEMLKILAFDQEKQMKGSLIFMIDERYVGQLERALAQQNLGWLKFDIPALDENLIADYLRQFALSFKFKEHYPILIDDRFAQTVASDLAKVDEPLGWRLHALLRLLWQRSIRKPVKWTLEAYEPIQKIGLDLKSLLIQRIDDFLQSAKVQMSEDELKEELMIDLLAQIPKFEEIDVEALLKTYLKYESQLPEPWLSHREMIKFQSIWFFNQCIDAGLISGYLNLGENLPKGKIKCLHPSIYEAIQEKKNQLLKKHSYLLERFKQEIEQKIRLSQTEILEIQDVFFKQALPTIKEAEYLQKAIAENRKADSPAIIQIHSVQHQVYSPQQKKRELFFKFAPILLLIISLSTCFSIQQKQSQIESKAKRLQVQMLLTQADEQLKENQAHMSVALLKEIDQLQDLQRSAPIWQAQWQQTTIHTLQAPIPSKFEQIKCDNVTFLIAFS